MNFVLDAVAGGFRVATRRLHFVLADMAAKFVWLLLTGAVGFIAIVAFFGQLAPPRSVPPELGGFLIASRLAAAGPGLFRTLLVAAVASFLIWSILEALVRSRIWRWTWGDDQNRSIAFGRFLASGIMRRTVFTLSAVMLALIVLGPAMADSGGQWSQSRWSVLTVVLLLFMVAFVLMLLDTLMRCDAVETIGTHLGAIVAAVATIGFFEVTIRMAALAGTVVLMNVLPAPAVILLVLPAIGIGLSLLHSYLLLVRYSAIGIIRNHSHIRVSTHNGPSYSL